MFPVLYFLLRIQSQKTGLFLLSRILQECFLSTTSRQVPPNIPCFTQFPNTNLWTFLNVLSYRTKREAARRQTSIYMLLGSYTWYSPIHSSPKMLALVPLDQTTNTRVRSSGWQFKANRVWERDCVRNYSSQNGQGRLSPLRETAVLLAASCRSTDSLVRRQKIMGISLFKGGIRAKSSEEHWNGTSGILTHPAEISAVFLSQRICFIFSITHAWEHDVMLKLTRTPLSVKASSSKREKWADDLLTTQIDSFCYPGPWNSAKF